VILVVKEPDPSNPGDLIVKNISSATIGGCLMRWTKPSGTVVTRVPAFVSSGTTGKIKIVSIATDFDEAGSYWIEAVVALSSGTVTSSETQILVEDTMA